MKFEHSLKSVTVSLGLLLLASQGCSGAVEEHERICRQNMKVIVHDNKLWREYRAKSEAIHQEQIRQDPPIPWRALYFPVEDFTVGFGVQRSRFRESIESKIVRNDVYVMKGDKTVVQIVDFVGLYSGIDGATSLDCLGFYENLIIGKR